jgi:hypothetical protein
MRPSLCRDLALLMLVAVVVRSPAFGGAPKPTRATRSVKSWDVKGVGVTEADARKNAMESLRVYVTDWLITYHPEITYSPSQAEIEALVREPSSIQPLERSNKGDLNELDQVQVLELSLKGELTDTDLRFFGDQSRHQLAAQRQGLFARGLAGAVGLLVVATGYLRLEEKVGRHKRKLGLAAVALLGVGVVGLTMLIWR